MGSGHRIHRGEGTWAPGRRRRHELVARWFGFLETDPYPSRIDHDPIGDWHRILFDFSQAVPLEVVLGLGRIAGALRTTLDDAVRVEAARFLGRDLTLSESRILAFPLRWRSSELDRASGRRFVSEAAWTIISRHQPYAGARSLGRLHWRSGLEQHGRVCPALPPGFETFLPFYGYDKAHATPIEVVHDLDPWSPLEGFTEPVRIRFARNGHDPQLTVWRTSRLHVICAAAPNGVRYVGATETIRDVRGIILSLSTWNGTPRGCASAQPDNREGPACAGPSQTAAI